MKLIATDLDGTLLNENHMISSENAKAIEKAQELGIQIVVATGRSYSSARIPMEKMGLTCPIICLNGAQVYMSNKELIRNVPLSKEVALQIHNACQKQGIYFELFTNKGVFSDSRENFIQVMVDIMTSANPDLSKEDVRSRAEMRFQDERVEIVEDYNAIFQQEDLDIYKFLAFSVKDEKLESVKADLIDDSEVAITSSGFDNLEFNHPKAQKGIALEFLSNKLSIDMKDVMAIGDNYNDVSMLKAAGRGVAMGNADDEIKQLCDVSTKSNKEDGVAYAIEKMLKDRQMI
ncbi:Cof-type HAD-IIB family hydrolase [Aquibacillus albus]|uniref:Cof subfamily protein (Haloacid dehalogenase superfamily) n=1 Tax=Aquibacillus albus TaxID=1168171 RepID=A0ABS2MYW0_9BACI|nr:Cof-type HAD-IIB family hydrolase [Aquibacillus albus]MBM7570855.1 Cof subfamily protein (haloacid dehalogenase superfamily) [Aquibacillus albus]